jgi:hypothetical protein
MRWKHRHITAWWSRRRPMSPETHVTCWRSNMLTQRWWGDNHHHLTSSLSLRTWRTRTNKIIEFWQEPAIELYIINALASCSFGCFYNPRHFADLCPCIVSRSVAIDHFPSYILLVYTVQAQPSSLPLMGVCRRMDEDGSKPREVCDLIVRSSVGNDRNNTWSSVHIPWPKANCAGKCKQKWCIHLPLSSPLSRSDQSPQGIRQYMSNLFYHQVGGVQLHMNFSYLLCALGYDID